MNQVKWVVLVECDLLVWEKREERENIGYRVNGLGCWGGEIGGVEEILDAGENNSNQLNEKYIDYSTDCFRVLYYNIHTTKQDKKISIDSSTRDNQIL